MYNAPTYKSKQIFWLLIKLSIVFGCAYFIWHKLNNNQQIIFSDFSQNLFKNDVLSIKNSILLLLFSFINWFLEILKWQTLVSFIKKNSFFSATKQSLASLTTSLITPNRIGEYGAKALYFEKHLRKKVLNLNFIGNLHQLFATVFFGVIGMGYFMSSQEIILNKNLIINSILIVCFVILASFLIWKYLTSKTTFFKNFTVIISKKQHLKISMLSFLRYLIFSHQMYFLILIFKIDISYIDAITAIFLMYLISSFIPMLSLFDAILKGSVAIFIFSFFSINSITILSVTTCMWVLNFAIPAIVGSYFVLIFNPNKKL